MGEEVIAERENPFGQLVDEKILSVWANLSAFCEEEEELAPYSR